MLYNATYRSELRQKVLFIIVRVGQPFQCVFRRGEQMSTRVERRQLQFAMEICWNTNPSVIYMDLVQRIWFK